MALLTTLLLATAAQGATAPPWTLVSNRNDIRMYVRDGIGTPLKTFRGVTCFALADEYAMVALLNDYDAYPDWLHFVDSARELSRDSEKVRRLRVTTLPPWPLADQEALLESRGSQRLEGQGGGEVVVQLHNRPEYQGRYFPFLDLNSPGRPVTATASTTLTMD